MIKLKEGVDPKILATELGLQYEEKIGKNSKWSFFKIKKNVNISLVAESLLFNSDIEYYDEPKLRNVVPFYYPFNDPLGPDSWHLGTKPNYVHADVLSAWEMGFKGTGRHIQIVDTGLETSHSEFANKIDFASSFDVVNNVANVNPSPSYSPGSHGTSCAGVAGGIANNEKCSAGVAYDAKVSAIKMLTGQGVYDYQLANAFAKYTSKVDVSSNSWGYLDNAYTWIDISLVVYDALQQRTFDLSTSTDTTISTDARYKKGVVYVKAAGNNGIDMYSCSREENNNTPWVILVSATGPDGKLSEYSSYCSSVMITAPSLRMDTFVSGIRTATTGNSCNSYFSGTSAATPIVAGCAALIIEANPNFTYRDVYQAIISTATFLPLSTSDPTFVVNKAGFKHSNKYGFGMVNCAAAVQYALSNDLLCPVELYYYPMSMSSIPLQYGAPSIKSIEVTNSGCVEQVTAYVTISHSYASGLIITLRSPSGTLSTLNDGNPRPPFLDCPNNTPVPLISISNLTLSTTTSTVGSVVFITLSTSTLSCSNIYIAKFSGYPFTSTTLITSANATGTHYVFMASSLRGKSCTMTQIASRWKQLGGTYLLVFPPTDNDDLYPFVLSSVIPLYTFNPHSRVIYVAQSTSPPTCTMQFQTPNVWKSISYPMSSGYRLMSLAFWGEKTKGNWMISITDTSKGITGSLNDFELEILTTDDKIFPNDGVVFPEDIKVSCNSPTDPDVTGKPHIQATSCFKYTIDYQDTFIGSGCPQFIERTWKFEHQCSDAKFSKKQLIIRNDRPETEPGECIDNFDCHGSLDPSLNICENGVCVRGCFMDSNCPLPGDNSNKTSCINAKCYDACYPDGKLVSTGCPRSSDPDNYVRCNANYKVDGTILGKCDFMCRVDNDCRNGENDSLMNYCIKNTCVLKCLTNEHCNYSPNGPFCDITTNQCTLCGADTQCNTNPAGKACLPSGFCGCEVNTDCSGKLYGSVCVVSKGTCGCLSETDCKIINYSVCTNENVCGNCSTNQDCALNPNGTICREEIPNICVARSDINCLNSNYGSKNIGDFCGCRVDEDCKFLPNTPACDCVKGKCIECKRDHHCSSWQRCNDANTCVALKCENDGDCFRKDLSDEGEIIGSEARCNDAGVCVQLVPGCIGT